MEMDGGLEEEAKPKEVCGQYSDEWTRAPGVAHLDFWWIAKSCQDCHDLRDNSDKVPHTRNGGQGEAFEIKRSLVLTKSDSPCSDFV